MSNQDIDRALNYLLEEEGGWSDNKNDHGGKTMYGVTQGTYDQWRRQKKRPAQSVRLITKDEARELYEEMYWRTSGCHLLPWPISYITFDGAVNSGPARSLKWSQAGLGVSADGKIGPATVRAAVASVESGDAQKILAVVDQRLQFLVSLVKRSPDQTTFLLGWMRRLQRVLARALLSELDS